LVLAFLVSCLPMCSETPSVVYVANVDQECAWPST
jgi:hypothetical protein